MKITNDNINIGILGLGYVGLPLAIEFGKKYLTIGFDTNQERIKELGLSIDRTNEVEKADFKDSQNLTFSSNIQDLSNCNIYIAAIPTPIDENNNPNLSLLRKCCESIAGILKKGDIVVFESTVYPGTTEEICAQILEEESGLIMNDDFFLGYSPERINPGDKENSITTIMKVTSGSTDEVAEFIDNLYSSIITAGTYKAESIKVAEAAKIIENTQRDVNIALMNEFSMIFRKLGIDTNHVIKAASTKWNFIPFSPGLVGGHCIGVDPYYLAYKSIEAGHNPKIILAGREINDSMSKYVAHEVIELMKLKGIQVEGSNLLILGATFKENTPDIRNSRVFDVKDELEKFNICVHISDPLADPEEVKHEYKDELITDLKNKFYDAVIIAVPHNEFMRDGVQTIKGCLKDNSVFYDTKSSFDIGESDGRL